MLIGPVEYKTGTTAVVKSKSPAGSNRKGVKVADLTDAQKALVVEAIEPWVSDYDASISDGLLAA